MHWKVLFSPPHIGHIMQKNNIIEIIHHFASIYTVKENLSLLNQVLLFSPFLISDNSGKIILKCS